MVVQIFVVRTELNSNIVLLSQETQRRLESFTM